jgi:type II secretory pathway pseudopilin PulG
MTATARTDDDGFGLVEAVVSMLVLATLAIAFLPLLITGLKQSATNSTTAFATQLVGERMSLAQAATSCSALTLVASSGTETDARGNQVDVTTTVQNCSAGRGTYSVTATARLVVGGVPGTQLATASTLVFLP